MTTQNQELRNEELRNEELRNEQAILLAGIPIDRAEEAREALSRIGITFTPHLRSEHYTTREHLNAVFQAYDLPDVLETLNDYLAFENVDPPVRTGRDNYDSATLSNIVRFLDERVEWCGREAPRDAIAFIDPQAWRDFIRENPGIEGEW